MKYLLSTVALLFFIPGFAKKKDIGEDRILFAQATALQQLIQEDLNLDHAIDSKDTTVHDSKIKAEYAAQIKETILDKALEYYNLLVDSFPGSPLLYMTLNNKGVIEYELEDYKEAKTTFLKQIEGKADDKESRYDGGIMGEPYANYRNRACKYLARIYIHDSDYPNAIKYLDLTKKYPYRHFCGNEYAAEANAKTVLYAKCYLAQKDYTNAYNVLLPNIISNGLANNREIVELAYKSLLEKYTKQELKNMFEESVRLHKFEKNEDGKSKDYYITFLNVKIYFYFGFQEIDTMQEAKIDTLIWDQLTNTDFYKLISKQ